MPGARPASDTNCLDALLDYLVTNFKNFTKNHVQAKNVWAGARENSNLEEILEAQMRLGIS